MTDEDRSDRAVIAYLMASYDGYSREQAIEIAALCYDGDPYYVARKRI